MKRINRWRPPTTVLTLSLMVMGLCSFAAAARGENEGQADLDKATQQKVGAQTSADFAEVIQLCESALKKGLDKNNTAFANSLMAAALVQRGGITAKKAYTAVLAAVRGSADENWKSYRSEALADLEKGVKLSPKQPQAYFEIARLNLLPGGDNKTATDALDKTIAQADDDAGLRAEALIQRAALRKSNTERLADLDQAVAALPASAGVWRARGLARAQAENWDGALADFDKAIAAEPKLTAVYQLKALLLVKLKRFPEALVVLDKAHKAVPDNLEVLWIAAEILRAQANYRAAAEKLTAALAIDASNLAVLQRRAIAYEHLGEKAKALADVEAILKIKPGLPEMMRVRAVLLSELGKYDAAIEVLQTLHKANPDDSLIMQQLGGVYMSMKKYEKAIDVYAAILTDRPDDVDAIRGRADAFLNLGRRADAEAAYERALKLQAHNVGILNNYAWVLATAPEDNLRDGHRALVLATDACRQTDFKQDFILSTLAAAYAETGDFDSARKWAAQAVESKPAPDAEASRKDELKKELQSYEAKKPWREALPEPSDAAAKPKKTESKPPAGEKSPAAKSKAVDKPETPKTNR